MLNKMIYNNKLTLKPFPHILIDNFLKKEIAHNLKNDILNIDNKYFDSFSNPFEKNKNFSHSKKKNLPLSVKKLFNYLNSKEWLNILSKIFNIDNIEGDKKLYLWGIHTYKNGGRLEPHLDAKICPNTDREKIITMCYYLSDNWEDKYGGNLVLWNSNNYKLLNIDKKICPKFNRLILFQSNENSYHSVDEIKNNIPNDSIRILITASFYRKISKNEHRLIKDQNRPYGLYKALFSSIKENKNIEELIKKRANLQTFNEVINMNTKTN